MNDMEKVKTTLKQFVRDWSIEVDFIRDLLLLY